MSAVANSARVTEISHQLIESNMEWKVSNPLPQESERVKIPLMNLEWYLVGDSDYLHFYLNIIEDDRLVWITDPNSDQDKYCFEYSYVNCSSSGKTPNGYQELQKANHDYHDISKIRYSLNLKAKVTIKRSRKGNSYLDENNMKMVCDDFSALKSDSTHSDFTIIVKSKEFKVHKSVLSVRSPVFKIMFLSNMKEATDNKVEINDIEPCTFEQLLVFIYSGKIPEDLDYYAMDLFVAADKYGIEQLRNECEKHIALNISKDNAMSVFNLTNIYSCRHDLKLMSFKFIKKKLQETLDVEIFEKLLKNVISFGTMINQTFKIEIDGEENENEYVDKIEDKDITDE